jgi:hypothetical protein
MIIVEKQKQKRARSMRALRIIHVSALSIYGVRFFSDMGVLTFAYAARDIIQVAGRRRQL